MKCPGLFQNFSLKTAALNVLSCVGVLLLLGCSTLATYIENVDDYTPFEIIAPDNALIVFKSSGVGMHPEIFNKNYQNKKLIMDDYYIVETDRISVFTNVPPKGQFGSYNSYVGGKYEFFNGETSLYTFELVTDSFITTRPNGSSTGSWRKFIQLADNANAAQTRIEPNMPNADVYFSHHDEDIGTITIRQYRSRSANQSPNSRWLYQTGFTIELEGEEYGILAFYPDPKLYKNNSFSKTIDEHTETKIILYLFMAYERFNREDDIFARQ